MSLRIFWRFFLNFLATDGFLNWTLTGWTLKVKCFCLHFLVKLGRQTLQRGANQKAPERHHEPRRPGEPDIQNGRTEYQLERRGRLECKGFCFFCVWLGFALTLQVLDNLTSRLDFDLKPYKKYIDNEILVTLAQMDRPSKIFDYLYLVGRDF